MIKPEKRVHQDALLDYHECAEFISDKLGYDIDDAKGNFWHWVIENNEVRNRDTLYFYRDEDINEDWVKPIFQAFIDEFADEEGTVAMWVEW